MTVIVLGRTGQVGSHLRTLKDDAAFWGRDQADLADPQALEAGLVAAAPSAIVNVAAYTAVDRAESEPALAWRVNAEAPAAAARAAAALGVPLIHVSTDYVFDGTAAGAYRETDPTAPINTYGRTKLAGELAVQTLCPRHWILRTSWVFSEHGSNFVKTMLRLAGERDHLSVVDDQRGLPTYAGHLAEVIAALLDQSAAGAEPEPGIRNVCGGPPVTWCEFASRIFEEAASRGLVARPPRVSPIATADYPTPARRPANSTLAPSATFLHRLGVRIDWQDGLAATLDHLARNQGADP